MFYLILFTPDSHRIFVQQRRYMLYLPTCRYLMSDTFGTHTRDKMLDARYPDCFFNWYSLLIIPILDLDIFQGCISPNISS